MAPRLVFCETERKVVSLSRGWRTPDPSPTRDAAGLPGCGLKLCLKDDPSNDGAGNSNWTPRGHMPKRSATPPRGQQRDIGCATGRFSRTPSPSPIARPPGDFAQAAPPLSAVTWKLSEELPSTPLPPIARPPGDFAQAAPPLSAVTWWSEESQAPTSQSPTSSSPYKISLASLTSSVTSETEQTKNDGLAAFEQNASFCKPCVFGVPQVMMVQPQQPAFPSIGNPVQNKSPGGNLAHPPSRGSIGHPFTCAEACKYAWKKRGCKEGHNCDRCHLCEWKKCPSSRMQQKDQ